MLFFLTLFSCSIYLPCASPVQSLKHRPLQRFSIIFPKTRFHFLCLGALFGGTGVSIKIILRFAMATPPAPFSWIKTHSFRATRKKTETEWICGDPLLWHLISVYLLHSPVYLVQFCVTCDVVCPPKSLVYLGIPSTDLTPSFYFDGHFKQHSGAVKQARCPGQTI